MNICQTSGWARSCLPHFAATLAKDAPNTEVRDAVSQIHRQFITPYIKSYLTNYTDEDLQNLWFSLTHTFTHHKSEKRQCLPIKQNEEVKDTAVHSHTAWHFISFDL